MAALQAKKQQAAAAPAPTTPQETAVQTPNATSNNNPTMIPDGKLFHFDASSETFLFDLRHEHTSPRLLPDSHDIGVPLAPCVYRMTDYTLAKKEPVALKRCLLKLGVLRCLQRECANLNRLLWHRFAPPVSSSPPTQPPAPPNLAVAGEENGDKKKKKSAEEPQQAPPGSLEEEELGKIRFMELLSNCGVFQKVSELILLKTGQASDKLAAAAQQQATKRQQPQSLRHSPGPC